MTKRKDKLLEVVDFIKELSNLKGNGTIDKLLNLINIIDDRLKYKNITVDFTVLKDVLESFTERNNNIKNKFSGILTNITDKLNQFKLSELLDKYNINNKKIINISNERINDIEKSLNDHKNDFIDKLSNINLSKLKNVFKGIKNKTMLLIPDEIQNPISNRSDFKILRLKESFNSAGSKIVKSIEDLKDFIYNFDIKSIKDLLQIEKIKNEVEKLKGYFNQSNATFFVEKERESVRKMMKEIKNNLLASLNKTGFSPLITKLKDINSLISDSFKKMESYEDFTKLVTKVKASNNALNAFFDKIQIFILNSYFSFRGYLDLNETSTEDYIKELGKDLHEQMKKLNDMETITEKISYILKSNLKSNKQRENLEKLMKSLKIKAKEANKTHLLKLIEKLNEMNTKVNKTINEGKAKVFLDKIIDIVDKITTNYSNIENLFKEKKEKLIKDLAELKNFKLSEQLNISYVQIIKDVEEYKEILLEIRDYYQNLPENANLTEIFEKHKVIILEEMKKIQKTLNDTFNELDSEYDLKNLKNKIMNSSLNGNLTQLFDDYFADITFFAEFFKKMNKSDLTKIFSKILNKLSMTNTIQILEFAQDMKITDSLNGTSNIKKAINFLNEIKSKFNQTGLSKDMKLLVEKFKELYECFMLMKNNSQIFEVIIEVISQSSESNKFDLSNLMNIIKDKSFGPKDLINIMKIQVLIYEIKDILTSSNLMKIIPTIFNKKSTLRSLSPSSKKKKRGLDTNQQLVCKMDQTFSEDDELEPETSDLKLYFLSDEEHELSISQSLKITVKKEEYNCSNDEYLAKLRSVYKMKNISDFEVEQEKLRVRFTIHVQKMAQFTPPSSFFYIIVKVGFKSIVHNLRRLADENENIESYCLLDDESNDEDNIFSCFAYSDNITELEDLEGIQNITSDYIDINSAEPDDNEYNFGINSFKIKKRNSLSGGAIAGMVLASIAVVAIIAAAFVYSKRKFVKTPNQESSLNSFNSINVLKTNEK